MNVPERSEGDGVDDDRWGAGDPQGDSEGPLIGQVVSSSPAARHRAREIDAALGGTKLYEGPARDLLPKAWGECDVIVSHLALGATTRLIAPLLTDKRTDPGVVVVDEAGRFAVPLVGGHAGGANDVARRIGEALGATPVLTTATDSVGIPALDTLGWAYEGDVAGVTRAVLDGRDVELVRDYRCPLPPLPPTVREVPSAELDAHAAGAGQPVPAPDGWSPAGRIVVTDRATASHTGSLPTAPQATSQPGASHTGSLPTAPQATSQPGASHTDSVPTVVLHPRSLVAGMGCNSGTDTEQLEELLRETLADAGLAIESLTAITTIDLKAGELGLVQLVARLGVPLVDFPAHELAAQDAPTPSPVVDGHVGSPSVAEASVLAHGAELIVPKRKSRDATCAVGRLPARGRLSVVGLGPGARDLLTPRAMAAVRGARFVVGYGPYVRQVRDLIRPGADVLASTMGSEAERTSAAIARAREGDPVALVCSGDPAVYAMASPVLEQGTEGIDVEIVPGVTAGLAVSAILGAPLGHDHVLISLSDLHTDWASIERRLVAAAEGDLVTVLYNPRSRTRRWQLPRALEILAARRPAATPAAVVQQAERRRQSVHLMTLADFDPEKVDMNSLVVVGSSTTRYVRTGGGERRMVTPRDYTWMAT